MKSQDRLKPEGTWEVLRHIKIPGLNHSAGAVAVEAILGDMPGIRKTSSNLATHSLSVRYDASQLNYHAITDALKNAGFPPLDTWWTRIKGGFYQYADTNARDNAKAPAPACCNKSPK